MDTDPQVYSHKWLCAQCRFRFDEHPAIEYQHLYPGCGGSCGYYSRICKKCEEEYRKLSDEDSKRLLERDHEIYHWTFKPSIDGPAQIKPREEKI